jgi:ankyrin repeat protein
MTQSNLFETITKGDLEEVKKEWKLALQDSQFQSYWRSSAFCDACYHGHLEIVKFFAEEACEVPLENKYLDQGLRYASSGKGDNLEIIRYLIGKGVDIRGDRNRALGWAVYKGSLEAVKFLVENGCDVNEYDTIGPSPVVEAAQRGFFHIVEYLCENGAKDADLARHTSQCF